MDPDGSVRDPISRSIESHLAESSPSQVAVITAKLEDALAREAALLRDKNQSLQQQATLKQEFEHRLTNSMQLIVSLLSLQSQRTESPEAAEQLTIAAKRVGAFGRVHRQLNRLDRLDTVELKQFVAQLCGDISGMLFDGEVPHQVVVEGAQITIPSALGAPLGFVVNELITNASKHGKGEIMVWLQTTPEHGHSISVSNGGSSLPDGFHPGRSKGLGLRIVLSLVRQINGRLQFGPGPGKAGACFKVFFPSVATPSDREPWDANGRNAGKTLSPSHEELD